MGKFCAQSSVIVLDDLPEDGVAGVAALSQECHTDPPISGERRSFQYPGLRAADDIYFGPQAPEGKESNWIQTIPGKGWNVILRFYGPLEPWFDQTWRPGEIELME